MGYSFHTAVPALGGVPFVTALSYPNWLISLWSCRHQISNFAGGVQSGYIWRTESWPIIKYVSLYGGSTLLTLRMVPSKKIPIDRAWDLRRRLHCLQVVLLVQHVEPFRWRSRGPRVWRWAWMVPWEEINFADQQIKFGLYALFQNVWSFWWHDVWCIFNGNQVNEFHANWMLKSHLFRTYLSKLPCVYLSPLLLLLGVVNLPVDPSGAGVEQDVLSL